MGAISASDPRYLNALTNAAAFDTYGAAATALATATNAMAQYFNNIGPGGDLSMGSYTNRGQ